MEFKQFKTIVFLAFVLLFANKVFSIEKRNLIVDVEAGIYDIDHIILCFHKRAIAEQIDRSIVYKNLHSVSGLSSLMAHDSGRNQENSVINKKEENIIEIIKEAINEKQNNAKSNNQVFAINFNKDKCNINIVKNDIYRVFLNLFDNAIKYSLKNSKIDINIKLSDKKDSNWQKNVPVLIIDVVDKGPGIKKEHLSRLTERFYRIDNVRNQQKGGKGLGLSIVSSIIEEHGGIIEVNSSKNTIFTVLFPQYEDS